MSPKAIFLFLAILLCSSCGTGGRTRIAFLWWPDPGGGFEEVISDFEKENPDIDVEMIKGPTSTDTREAMYLSAFLAGEATYDLVLMDVVWLPKFARQGWLVPLDDWFGEEERDKFLPADIRASIFEGKIYRIPLQTDAGVLYYRRDLLEGKGYGPPRTWDEFVEISGKLQSPPDLWGFVFQGKQYEGLVCGFLEILWSFDGDLFDEDGNLVLNSPAAAQALNFMHDLIHVYKIAPPGITTYEEEESRHLFQEGRAIFCRNWPYLWSLAQKNGSPVKGKIGVIPLPYESVDKPRSCLGGWGFGISKFTENKDACVKFLKFAASYESQKKLHLKSGVVPTRKALFEDGEILDRSPFYAELYQILLLAKPRPMHPDYARISDILRRYIHKVLLKELSCEAALRKAESDIKEVLKRQGPPERF